MHTQLNFAYKVNASAERLSSSDVLTPSKKVQQVVNVQLEAYLTKVLIRQTCSFKIGSRMAQCQLSSTVHCEIWGTATSKDLLELRQHVIASRPRCLTEQSAVLCF